MALKKLKEKAKILILNHQIKNGSTLFYKR